MLPNKLKDSLISYPKAAAWLSKANLIVSSGETHLQNRQSHEKEI